MMCVRQINGIACCFYQSSSVCLKWNKKILYLKFLRKNTETFCDFGRLWDLECSRTTPLTAKSLNVVKWSLKKVSGNLIPSMNGCNNSQQGQSCNISLGLSKNGMVQAFLVVKEKLVSLIIVMIRIVKETCNLVSCNILAAIINFNTILKRLKIFKILTN